MQVIIYFFIMFSFFWKVRKENSIRRWVYGLFCFSALCSLIYPLILPIKYEQSYIAYIYYTVSTLLLLYPIHCIGNTNCKDFEFPSRYINLVSYILILFGIISISNILPQLFTLRTFLNNMSEVRSAYYHGEELTETSSSLIGLLANWVMYVQFFSPTFAFLNFIKKKKFVAILLCVVSLVPALNKLLIGEREACVVVLSNFLFAYIFFKPLLTKEYIEKIKKIGLLFIIPLALFIVAMTVSRFIDTDEGVGAWLVIYIGEQPINFSYFFTQINIDTQCLGGKLNFPYLFPKSEQLEGRINDYILAGESLNTFAGIPGSLLLDFSYSAILVMAFIAFIFRMIFKRSKNSITRKYDFSIFMFFLIYYQIIFMGIFYLDFTSKYVVIMCFILFLLYYFTKRIFHWRKLMI